MIATNFSYIFLIFFIKCSKIQHVNLNGALLREGGRPVLRILAVSDVESKYIWEYFDPAPFRDVDVIISCGDLKSEYLSYLVTMIPAPLFYVHGNHDGQYKRRPPLGCEDIDGRLVEFAGMRIIGLGGCCCPLPAREHEYTDEQMWKRYRRLRPAIRRAGGVDILVSHAAAIGLGDGEDIYHRGFEALRYIDETHEPKLHLFGHRHLTGNPIARDAMFRFKETTMINATGYRIIDIKKGTDI